MANSENSISKLKVWFEQALVWLYVDGSNKELQLSHQKLLKLMEDAYKSNQSSQVWKIIEELEELTRACDPLDRGETLFRCAKTACDLENLKEALYLCNEVEVKFKTYPHSHAVVLWMIGCIHWIANSHVKAITNWQETIEIFKTQQRNWSVDTAKTDWYTKKVKELGGYLELAIETDELPEYTSPSYRNIGDPALLTWVDCEVHDEVPAGGFGAVGYEPIENYLGISEVVIDGISHKAFKIRNLQEEMLSDPLIIQRGVKYHTVHVKGDSMNDADPVPIENGDFVFVRAQSNANNNEIVVVEIRNEDSAATIKRLQKNGNRLILIPETTDENIKQLPEFNRDYSERELFIVGVVEAVFKKKAG